VRWRYWRCARCGHAWLDPSPTREELTRYYNTVYSVPRDLYVAHVPREYRALKPLLERHGVVPGRMLEIGCSYGAMLDAFRRDGWDVEGIELDSRAAAVARSLYSLRIHEGPLEDVRSALRGDYDVITLYHVLEHVDDQISFVRDLASLCRPGGLVVIKTPNAQSLPARVLDGWWEWFAAPEHLRVFSPTSLRRLLEPEGFATELILSRRGDASRTLFELVRGTARRFLRRPVRGEVEVNGPGFTPSPPLSHRRWYRVARAVIDSVGAPLDWMLAPFQSPRHLLGPELLVLARRAGR
jgi:SAM-dependent methyltransferase